MESSWNPFQCKTVPSSPCRQLFQSLLIPIHLPNFPGILQDYCQWDAFNVSCSHGDVVVMTSARYGRMRVGSCVRKSYDTIGCTVNVMRYSDSRCSGRPSCIIKVPDISSEEGIRPCPEDLTSYFEASYTCIPGNHFVIWVSLEFFLNNPKWHVWHCCD